MAAPTKKPKQGEGKQPRRPRRGMKGLFGGPSFLGNLVTTVLIFLILMSLYSLVSSFMRPSDAIPLSTVASDVAKGSIKSITVNGDSLDLVYQDGTTKSSRKDPSS